MAREPLPVIALEPLPVIARAPLPVIALEPLPVIARAPLPVIARAPLPVIALEPLPVIARAPLPVIALAPLPVIAVFPLPVMASPSLFEFDSATVMVGAPANKAATHALLIVAFRPFLSLIIFAQLMKHLFHERPIVRFTGHDVSHHSNFICSLAKRLLSDSIRSIFQQTLAF
jgi:hypothetical protein